MFCHLHKISPVLLIITGILTMFLLNQCIPSESTALRMNHIQVIGSHNSYKQAIQPELFDITSQQSDQLAGLEYYHLSIEEQLDMGLRKLELDVFHDPKGGRFSRPGGNLLLEKMQLRPDEFDPQQELKQPGFKVFHVQDIDFRSHCLLFKDCLNTIKQWSDANPDHLPIIITINVKTHPIDDPNAVLPLPFTPTTYDSLDQVIYNVLGRSNMITPGMLQRDLSSLNEAILEFGWPTLENVRGKFLFVLDEPMSKINTYLRDDSLKDRLMFVNAPAGHPASAFLIMNDPIRDEELIKKRVKEGYIVRTRADADTREARTKDYTRFEAAKRSGAQYISTDYYFVTEMAPEFVIRFEDKNFVRCNPVTLNSDTRQVHCNLK